MLLDKDIREPLFEFLEESCGRIRILQEKNIGSSRADVVMVTEDAICGIEIKSDADSYARLAGQVKDYDRYYDYNYVVVGVTHAHHIREHVPEYWGVITVEEVDGVPDFYLLRSPQPNPKMQWKCKMKILWRPELVKLQELHGLPKYKEKRKEYVIGVFAERISRGAILERVIRREISELLMERDYTTVAKEIADYRRTNRR